MPPPQRSHNLRSKKHDATQSPPSFCENNKPDPNRGYEILTIFESLQQNTEKSVLDGYTKTEQDLLLHRQNAEPPLKMSSVSWRYISQYSIKCSSLVSSSTTISTVWEFIRVLRARQKEDQDCSNLSVRSFTKWFMPFYECIFVVAGVKGMGRPGEKVSEKLVTGMHGAT